MNNWAYLLFPWYLSGELHQLRRRRHAPWDPLHIPGRPRRCRHRVGFRHPTIERDRGSQCLVRKHLLRQFIRLVIWKTRIPINIHFTWSNHCSIWVKISRITLPRKVFAFLLTHSQQQTIDTLTADFLNHKVECSWKFYLSIVFYAPRNL